MKMIILGLVMFMGVAGGIEQLPPDATAIVWAQLLAVALVSASVMLIGVSNVNNPKG